MADAPPLCVDGCGRPRQKGRSGQYGQRCGPCMIEYGNARWEAWVSRLPSAAQERERALREQARIRKRRRRQEERGG